MKNFFKNIKFKKRNINIKKINFLRNVNLRETIHELLFFQFTKTDKTGRIRNTFREIIYYLIFLTFATTVIISHASYYWFSDIIKKEFVYDSFATMYPKDINIFEIRNLEEVWIAMDNILFESIYWTYWYKDDNVIRREKMDLYMIGVPRIRQLRVKQSKCELKRISKLHEFCYETLTNSNMDTEPFGLKNDTAWIFHSASELDGKTYSGKLQNYNGGGYYQNLKLNKFLSKEIVTNLKENLWLTRQSRVIFIDFTVYNGNVNVFVIVKIVFELPPTGGVIVSYNIDNAKIYEFSNIYDFFILGCDLICLSFFIYYTVIMVKSLKKYKMQYFHSRWNQLELVIITFGFMFIILCIYTSIIINIAVAKMKQNPKSFINFEKVGYCYGHIDNIISILLLLVWIKLFKYIELNKTLGQLNTTIQKSAFDLAGFLIIFILIFVAYAQLGFLLFGSNLADFKSVLTSTFTLLKSINGEFNYNEIEKTAIFIGPIYFVSFIFLVFFVLMNMFLAIICDAYAIVKNEIGFEDDKHDVSNFLKRGGRKIFRNFPTIIDLLHIPKSDNKMKQIRKLLKMAKYSDTEINLLFSHYYFDDKNDVTSEEVREFVKDLHDNNYEVYEAADFIRNKEDINTYVKPHELINQQMEIETLERNIAHLYSLIGDITNKKRIIKKD